MSLLRRFYEEEDGGDAMEYALIGAAIVTGLFAGLTVYSDTLGALYGRIAAAVGGAFGAA